jgi:hypothetical protein
MSYVLAWGVGVSVCGVHTRERNPYAYAYVLNPAVAVGRCGKTGRPDWLQGLCQHSLARGYMVFRGSACWVSIRRESESRRMFGKPARLTG